MRTVSLLRIRHSQVRLTGSTSMLAASRRCGPSLGKSSVRSKRFGDVFQFAPCDHPALQGFARALPKKVRREAVLGAVVKCACRAGRGHRSEPRTLRLGNVGVVDHDAVGHAEALPSPGERKGQMGSRRQRVRQVVKRQRRLVGEDALAFRPQPRRDEIFMLAGREVDEPIDSAADPDGASRLDVVDQQLG